MVTLELYYSSKIKPLGCDLETIFSLLDKLRKLLIDVELVDTAELDDKKLHDFYVSEAVYPTLGRHYRIGHIFGTQRTSGQFFGKEQPALLVYEAGSQKATDIFPHTIKGQRITIEEFLREKLNELE